MKIFDTHVHYDDQAFDQDREAVITGLNGENVANITNIGFDLESSRSTVELTKKYPFIYGAVGIIPEHAHEGNEENLAEIEKLASENEKVCAIGEIGLDYHYDDGPSKEKQAEVFLARMDIARRLGLPIAIHSRDDGGYAESYEEGPCGGNRRSYALLFLFLGDSRDPTQNGILFWYRWCGNI